MDAASSHIYHCNIWLICDFLHEYWAYVFLYWFYRSFCNCIDHMQTLFHFGYIWIFNMRQFILPITHCFPCIVHSAQNSFVLVVFWTFNNLSYTEEIIIRYYIQWGKILSCRSESNNSSLVVQFLGFKNVPVAWDRSNFS